MDELIIFQKKKYGRMNLSYRTLNEITNAHNISQMNIFKILTARHGLGSGTSSFFQYHALYFLLDYHWSNLHIPKKLKYTPHIPVITNKLNAIGLLYFIY